MFLFPEHQYRYDEFIRRDGTNLKDRERQALFYVFAASKNWEIGLITSTTLKVV